MGFWSSVGGLAGAAVGSLVGMPTLGYGIGSSLGSNYDSNRAFNKQKDLNWQMWDAENAYNHPTQQMARLREAGLNPNLVYGSGATTLSASTKGSPSYQMPQGDILQTMNAYQDLVQKDAMTQNIQAQTIKSYADALTASKDFDVYEKTGYHPGRDTWQNAANMLVNGIKRVFDKGYQDNGLPSKTDIVGKKLGYKLDDLPDVKGMDTRERKRKYYELKGYSFI